MILWWCGWRSRVTWAMVWRGWADVGAAKKVQHYCKHYQKRMATLTQRPQNHYPRSVRASATSPKNRTSAHWLPASWNERSRSRPTRFKHLRRFSFFVFFEMRREIASVSNGGFRSEKQIGDEPTSNSATPTVAFWNYACNGFGDTRRLSRDV